MSFAVTFGLPDGAESLRYTVTIPGLLIRDVEVAGSPSTVMLELDQDELYAQGYTNVVLGADSMEITLAGTVGGNWFARALNLRGVSPLGGGAASIVEGAAAAAASSAAPATTEDTKFLECASKVLGRKVTSTAELNEEDRARPFDVWCECRDLPVTVFFTDDSSLSARSVDLC